MKPPTISVVTPCLNAVGTIGRTVQSIRDQEGGDRVQHLVIDGGSTDGTLELLAELGGIEVMSEPDDGLSDALNKGLDRAEGDIVGWLNADDIYLPGALDAVRQAYAGDPATTWITGQCRIIDGDDEEIRPLVTRYKNRLLHSYSYPLLLTQNFISAPSTFITRAGLQVMPKARLDYRYSMDYDLWLHLGRDRPPTIIEQELAAFRMVEGTLSMTGFERQFREHSSIARAHAGGGAERAAAMVNVVTSQAIVVIYRTMSRLRRRSAGT